MTSFSHSISRDLSLGVESSRRRSAHLSKSWFRSWKLDISLGIRASASQRRRSTVFILFYTRAVQTTPAFLRSNGVCSSTLLVLSPDPLQRPLLALYRLLYRRRRCTMATAAASCYTINNVAMTLLLLCRHSNNYSVTTGRRWLENNSLVSIFD